METLKLTVVRHGETDWSRERRYTGSRDVPLSAAGQRQAEAVAGALAGTVLTEVYTSPLERTRICAELIAKPRQLEVRLEPAFREMGFGGWEGLTRDEVAARFPADHEAWRTAPQRVTPPGGERLDAVAGRVGAALAELRAEHPGGTVVLVTHAVVIRLLVLAALGLGLDRLWSVDASPAGITELEYVGDWVTVHRMNTTAHLAEPA